MQAWKRGRVLSGGEGTPLLRLAEEVGRPELGVSMCSMSVCGDLSWACAPCALWVLFH